MENNDSVVRKRKIQEYESKNRKRKRFRRSDKPKNLLSVLKPEIFAQLKQELNIGIDLTTLTWKSGKMMTWCCIDHKTCNEHIWRATISNRVGSGSQCPFCNTIHYKGGPIRYCKCSRPSFFK